MIFPSDEEWKEWGIDSELHKFIVLRFREIFHEDTFDSWQVRFSNPRTILNEILDAIEVAEKVDTYHTNIRILLDEAVAASKKDVVITRFFPFLSHYLEDLISTYKSKVKVAKNKDIEAFRRKVLVTIGNLENYRKHLIDCIQQYIKSPPGKYKKELYSFIMLLGVELVSEGYSTKSLQNIFGILTDPKVPDFVNRFELLLSIFRGDTDEYSCKFFVSWPFDFPDLEGYDVKLEKNEHDMVLDQEEERFYQQDSQSAIANVKVTSVDPYSARYSAEEILESIFAMSLLYRPTKRPKIKQKLALVTLPDGSKLSVEPDTSRLTYIRDAKNAKENIAAFSDFHSRLDKHDTGQLSASLQYHKLSVTASTDEARLVNLWIALESLVQYGGKHIIERICKYVPTSLATSYVYSVLKNFAIDIRELWRNSDTGNLRADLSKSNQYLIHPRDMSSILLDEEDGKLITQLGEMGTNNPLFIYRLYVLWKDFFGDPKNFIKRLDTHRKNVDWQIRRIYRARNHVMHQGVCLPRTRQLIQHLHSYYVVTIHNLIFDLKKNPNWRISDAFENRLLIYDYYLDRLKKHHETPISVEALIDPLKSIFSTDDDPVWSNKKNDD